MLRRGSSKNYTTETKAWLGALSSRPSVNIIKAVDRAARRWQNAGIWSLKDGIFLYAAPDSATAVVDVRTPSRVGTINGAPTFTAQRGFTGTSVVGQCIDTGFIPNTHGVSYTLNSAHQSAFILNESLSNAIEFGASSGSSSYMIIRNGNQMQTRINDVTTATSAGVTSSIGLAAVNRDGPASTAQYRNGVLLAAGSVVSSAILPNASLKSLGIGGVATSGNHLCAVHAFGGGLTSPQMLADYEITRDLLAELSVI